MEKSYGALFESHKQQVKSLNKLLSFMIDIVKSNVDFNLIDEIKVACHLTKKLTQVHVVRSESFMNDAEKFYKNIFVNRIRKSENFPNKTNENGG